MLNPHHGHYGAKWDAIVTDFMGRRYVAIHPGYAAATAQDYRRALATRIAVCVVSFAALVLNVVGQVVPYYTVRSVNPYDLFYSTWQTWTGRTTWMEGAEVEPTLSGILGVVATPFLLIACVLAGVMACTWSRDERDRLEDRASSELAMAEFGRPREAYGDRDDADDGFPYTNLRVMNAGQVRDVRYERSELARRRYDRYVCAATLSMLIVGAIMDVCSLSFMGLDFNYAHYVERVNCRIRVDLFNNTYYSCNDVSYRVQAGLPLMAFSTVLAIAALVVVAIPQATKVRLCGALRPQACVLMVMDDETAAAVAAELGQLSGGDAAVLARMTPGVRQALVAAPVDGGVAGVRGAGEARVDSTLYGHADDSAARREAELESYVYASASYYAAAPQLFRVSDTDADASVDVVVDGRPAEGVFGDGARAGSAAPVAETEGTEMSHR